MWQWENALCWFFTFCAFNGIALSPCNQFVKPVITTFTVVFIQWHLKPLFSPLVRRANLFSHVLTIYVWAGSALKVACTCCRQAVRLSIPYVYAGFPLSKYGNQNNVQPRCPRPTLRPYCGGLCNGWPVNVSSRNTYYTWHNNRRFFYVCTG